LLGHTHSYGFRGIEGTPFGAKGRAGAFDRFQLSIRAQIRAEPAPDLKTIAERLENVAESTGWCHMLS
jgi:hypothetical protein